MAGGMPRPTRWGIAAALVLMLAVTAHAQTPSAPAAIAAKPQDYRPGFADLMLTYVQPRHAKLGLAGREGNWPLAAFNLKELKHALEAAGQQVPKWRELLIPDMTQAVIAGPITALEAAIKARDATAFQREFQQLTAGCNACHAAANLAYITIKAPADPTGQSTFPNQEFAPAKK